MDLVKIFDCLPINLLWLNCKSQKFMSCLEHFQNLVTHFQRVKLVFCFSLWLKILLGVPQGSAINALLFNIF